MGLKKLDYVKPQDWMSYLRKGNLHKLKLKGIISESHCEPQGKREKSTNLSNFKEFMISNCFNILGFHFPFGFMWIIFSWECWPKVTKSQNTVTEYLVCFSLGQLWENNWRRSTPNFFGRGYLSENINGTSRRVWLRLISNPKRYRPKAYMQKTFQSIIKLKIIASNLSVWYWGSPIRYCTVWNITISSLAPYVAPNPWIFTPKRYDEYPIPRSWEFSGPQVFLEMVKLKLFCKIAEVRFLYFSCVFSINSHISSYKRHWAMRTGTRTTTARKKYIASSLFISLCGSLGFCLFALNFVNINKW